MLKTFYEDIRTFILEQLKPICLTQKSIEFINIAEVPSLLQQFIYFRKRYPIGRYQVYITKNLSLSKQYTKYKSQILHIKKLFEEGKDIKNYLHNDITDFLFHDNLLNDWGIIHLHLWPKGSRKNKDNDILYAIQIDNCILFLKVDTHKCFLEKELLEILYQNQPNFLSFSSIEGNAFKEIEIKALRNKGIGYAIKIGDKSFYGGMNHILTLSGCVQILENLKSLSRLIFLNFIQIKDTISKKSHYVGNIKLHLKFNSANKTIFLYEINTGTKIILENNNIVEKLNNCFINLHLF